jgi:hypothetical protein
MVNVRREIAAKAWFVSSLLWYPYQYINTLKLALKSSNINNHKGRQPVDAGLQTEKTPHLDMLFYINNLCRILYIVYSCVFSLKFNSNFHWIFHFLCFLCRQVWLKTATIQIHSKGFTVDVNNRTYLFTMGKR